MPELSRADILESKNIKTLMNPEIILTLDEASDEVIAAVPETWWSLLTLGDVNIPAIQELWMPVYDKIPWTMEEMEATLQGVVILNHSEGSPSLLYVTLAPDGEIDCLEGFPPIPDTGDRPLETIDWPQINSEIRNLYRVHDGWIGLGMISDGFLPVQRWRAMSSFDFQDEDLERLEVDPHNVIFVFRRNKYYIGFELPEEENGLAKPLRWVADDPASVDFDIDFWSEVDELAQYSFSEMIERDD